MSLLTVIKRHVWKCAGIIACVFKMYENFSTEKCTLGQKALIFSHESFFMLLWLCPYNGNENYYSFFITQPLLAPWTMTWLSSLFVVLLYLDASVSEGWEVEGQQRTSVDMLLSVIFCTNLHAKIATYFSSQTWLPTTSFPSTVHPNGFILPSSREVCSVSLQGLATAPHPFPLPRSRLYMLTLILLLAYKDRQMMLLLCTTTTITMYTKHLSARDHITNLSTFAQFCLISSLLLKISRKLS